MPGPATKTYEVTYNGYKTRMKLNDADAERLGVKKPAGGSAGGDDTEKAARPANKMGRAENKSAPSGA